MTETEPDQSSELQQTSESLLGVFLVGLTFVVVSCHILFHLGFPISEWHWLLFPLGCLIGVIILRPRSWLKLIALVGLAMLLILLFGWYGSFTYGVNWDGMFVHKEYVMVLMDGWNPVADPYFTEGLGYEEWEASRVFRKIEWGGYNVRNGYLFLAILGDAMNSVEAAKGINILLMLIPGLATLAVFLRLGIRRSYASTLAILVVLNPVSIMQFISFWEDIHFACFSVVAVLLAAGVSGRPRPREVLILLLSIFLLLGSKRSGVAFAGVITVLGVLSYIIRYRMSLRGSLWSVFGGIGMIIVMFLTGQLFGIWKSHGFFPYTFEQITEVSKITFLFDSEFAERFPNVSSLSGGILFLASQLSEGVMAVRDLSFKFPFFVTQSEVDLYYHVFTGPWFGGFGPWFGASLVLMFMLRLLHGNWRNSRYHFLWVWILGLFALLWFMPAFYPRWIPFAWLFPILVFLTFFQNKSSKVEAEKGVFSLRKNSSLWRKLGVVTILLLTLNSGFVLVLNQLGHRNASRILDMQLEFLSKYVEQPISVDFGSFISTRDWLRRTGLEFNAVDSLIEKPSMNLHRTDTLVELGKVRSNMPVEIGGETWSSVTEWAHWIEKRSGHGDAFSPWIHPVFVIKNQEGSLERFEIENQ
jgi:hypothetical protein